MKPNEAETVRKALAQAVDNDGSPATITRIVRVALPEITRAQEHGWTYDRIADAMSRNCSRQIKSSTLRVTVHKIKKESKSNE